MIGVRFERFDLALHEGTVMDTAVSTTTTTRVSGGGAFALGPVVVGDAVRTSSDRLDVTELWLREAGGRETQFIVPAQIAVRPSQQVRVYSGRRGRSRPYVFKIVNRTTGETLHPTGLGFDAHDVKIATIVGGALVVPLLILFTTVFGVVLRSLLMGVVLGLSSSVGVLMWWFDRKRKKAAARGERAAAALDEAARQHAATTR